MKSKKRQAFTLTELLVIVVIIGVLAAVILPKFNKMAETRRTTEAEDLMAAIRTEQEYRCAIDKPYAGEMEELSSLGSQPQLNGAKATTNNFEYELKETGMIAKRTGGKYNLQLLSYADGRICCDDCQGLNKDYPSCSELQNKEDFRVFSDCAADVPGDIGVTAPSTCTDPKPSLNRNCDTGCGSQSRTATCNLSTLKWDTSQWSPACKSAQTETSDCEEGYDGTRTRTQVCNTATGEWTYEGVAWDESACTPKTTEKKCSEWDAEVDGLEAYCNAKGKIYDSWSYADKKKSSAEACCVSCAQYNGAEYYVWDDQRKECISKGFHKELDTSVYQYRIYYDKYNPEYTYTFNNRSNPFLGGGTTMDVFTQARAGLEESCLLHFLDNDSQYDNLPECGDDFCSFCDWTKDTCDVRCYDETEGRWAGRWGGLLEFQVQASGSPIPNQTGTVGAYDVKQGDQGWTVYNGDGSVRGGSGMNCDYSGCTVDYGNGSNTPTTYTFDCSPHGLSHWWQSVGTNTVTCTTVKCGDAAAVTPKGGNVHWTGSAGLSPLVDFRHSVYRCVKDEN